MKITNVIKQVIALAFMFYASSAFSLIEIDGDLGTDDGYTRIIMWEWEETKDAPNPCYGAPVCYVMPDILGHIYRPTLWRNYQQGQYIEAQMYEKASQVRDAWVKKYPLTTYLSGYYRFKQDSPKCAKMWYSTKTPTAEDDISPQEFPGTTCYDVVPTKQICMFELEDREVQFGQINLAEINGKKKYVKIVIACMYGTNIHIYAMSDTNEEKVYLSKDRKFYAKLSMDGQNLFKGVSKSIFKWFDMHSYYIEVELGVDGYSVPSGNYTGNMIIYFVHD